MNDVKTKERYDGLILWKNIFIFLNPFLFVVGFIFFEFYSFIFCIPFCYVTMMIFLAKNNCPWCDEPFFLFTDKGIDANGLSLLYQTQCINCGKPDQS